MPLPRRFIPCVPRARQLVSLLAAATLLLNCESGTSLGVRPAAPGVVTDLRISEVTDSSATLSFVEVGDGAGHAAGYDVRFGTPDMTWSSGHAVARGSCAAPMSGTSIGAQRTCTVLGLEPATEYGFAVTAFRESPTERATAGSSSNIVRGKTADALADSIAVTPSVAQVVMGDSLDLQAILTDRQGRTLDGRTVTWESADPSVATISTAGRLTAVAPGNSVISATFDQLDRRGPKLRASAAITVAATNPGAVNDLAVDATTETSVTVSFTEVDDGTGLPANYDVRVAPAPLSWGTARSVTQGSCTTPVTGSVIGARRSCMVLGLTANTNYNFQLVPFRGTLGTPQAVFGPLSNIVAARTSSVVIVPVATVGITPASASVSVGQTVQLSATARDANGNTLTGRTITWGSSNTSVATVNASGLVAGVAAGSATLTATSEGKVGQAQVTVNAIATKPSAVNDLAVIGVTESSATLSFTEVNDGTGVPASYDVRVAVAPISWGTAKSITQGTCTTPVNGMAIGAARTCTVLGLSPSTRYDFQLVPFRGALGTPQAVFGPLSNTAGATTTASAPAPVATVTVTPSSANLTVGQTLQLTATAKDANGNTLTGRTITWMTSSAAIASVSGAGLVSATGAGTVTLTATSEGQNGQAQITVTVPAPVPVAAVTIAPSTATVLVGQTVQLAATTKDANGTTLTGRTVTWSSGDPSVATVSSSGVVTGVGAGAVTMTATSEGIGGQAQVTVTMPAPPAPSVVNDLAVTAISDSSVTLSFTEVNDGTGAPASYDVRVAVAPISWSTATSVTQGSCATPVAGTSIGAQRTCTVLGLTPSTSYNVQLVSFRGTLGTTAVLGPLSNVVAATTQAPLPPPPAPVATVTISPSTVNGVIGQTAQLSATLRDVSGNILTGRTVTWATSDNAIATVSSNGLVTEMGAGSATITATSEGKTGQAQIVVAPPAPAPVATVIVTPPSASVAVGKTVQLTATTRDASGNTLTGRTITWATSNAAFATVSSSGLVTAVSAGTVAITATSEGMSGQAQVTVTAATAPSPVNDLAVAATADSSVTLSFTEVNDGTGAPANYDVRVALAPLSWGTAKSVAQGTCSTPVAGATIGARRTCSVAGLSPSTRYEFELVPFRGPLGTPQAVFGPLSNVVAATTQGGTVIPVATVSVTPATANLTVGQTLQLTATTRDANGNTLTGRTITWTTSSSAIATVNATGLVTAAGAGTVTLTATSEGQTGQAQIAVTTAAPTPVATVTVSPASASVVVGQTVQLSVTTRDANGNTLTGRTITWASGSTGTATVNGSGLVTSVAAGSVIITATSEGQRGQAQITVSAPTPMPVATVSISPSTASVAVGSTVQLTATTRDANGATLAGRVVSWSSGNPMIATVGMNGLVAGVAAGTVTITATSEGKTGQSQVTVNTSQPTGPDEPQDPGAGYLWTDDFDRYASVISMMSTGTCAAGSDGAGLPSAESVYGRRTAHAAGSDTQACNEEINAGGVVRYQLITGRNGSGKALRGAVATTTTSQGIDWLSPWGTGATLAHDVTKSLVVQFYFRVSPGGLPGSVGMKWFELWVNELGGRPVQRLQWSTNGGSQTQWRVTDGPNTMSGPGRALQAIPPRLSTVNDGNWHRATFLFKANSSTTYRYVSGSTSATEVYSGSSSRDGRMAMWVDGIKIIDIQQSLVNVPVPGGGGAVWCYQGDVDWIPHVKGEYIMWPSTINSPMPNPPWTLDHDDLKVWQF